MRRWIIVGISVLVSAVFLWLALRDVPLSDVWAGIQRAQIGWILLSLIGVVGAQATRAVRWRGLLDDKIPLSSSFHILNVMMMMNQVPLRVGEVARVLLATRSGVPLVTAATSIVVERLIDIVAVIVLLAFALSRLPNIDPVVTQTAALFGAAAVIGFAALIAFARYPAAAHRLLTWIEARFPLLKRVNLTHRLEEMIDGLKPLTHAKRAAHAVGWTIIAWGFSLATFYAVQRSLDLSGFDLWLAAALTVPLVAFSIAIPVTVASLGPFQGAVRIAGEALGITPANSITLGFLFHGITVISYSAWGVIGFIALGVSLREVMTANQKEIK
jgi:uncharacterized protein (TIRG00374 family)